MLDASCKNRDGLKTLMQTLEGRTSVFVGQSGVGKSSLVNALLPEVDARVGALSEAGDKGTHTTTTAELFHLPSGGAIIDSPGIREFGLWHMERAQIEAGLSGVPSPAGPVQVPRLPPPNRNRAAPCGPRWMPAKSARAAWTATGIW